MERNPYHTTNIQSSSVAAMGEMMMETVDPVNDVQMLDTKPFSMKELLSLTEELTALLEQESMLLKEGRISEVEPYREKKERLASALDMQKKRLNQNPEMLQKLGEQEKSLLERTVERFTVSAVENKKRIEAARAVNQRIFAMIGKAAQRIHKHTPYTSLGKTAAAPRHAVAMKFNERI